MTASHPLIKLAAILPWATLISLIVAGLERTTPKGAWVDAPKAASHRGAKTTDEMPSEGSRRRR